MKLIAGLGNPGRSYSRHRHNVGFRVVEELAHRHGIDVTKRSFQALVGSGAVCGMSVLLVKPQTYMNLSGEAIRSLLGYYRLPKDELIVIHDDIDLDCGRIKLARNAGHGGHNGIRSIIDALHTKDFFRVRVGVGRPPAHMEGADYVLAPFAKAEEEIIAQTILRTAEAVELLLQEGLEKAQQEYH